MPRHAEMLEHVMGRGSKVNQQPVHDSRLPLQSDAETMANLAAAAVAADEITTAHLFRRSISQAQRGRNALRILRQLLKRDAPSRLDCGERLHRTLKDRLDLHLRDAHRRLARHAPLPGLTQSASP